MSFGEENAARDYEPHRSLPVAVPTSALVVAWVWIAIGGMQFVYEIT